MPAFGLKQHSYILFCLMSTQVKISIMLLCFQTNIPTTEMMCYPKTPS